MKASIAMVLLAGASAFAASDPSLLGLVMPDAKAVTGLNVSQSQTSPFGQYILSQMKPGADFDKLSAAVGFDPKRDLHELLGATTSFDTNNGSANQTGLILGRGNFQPAKIATAVKLGGATATTYKGFEILVTTAAGKSGTLVFLDSSTVVLGDLASVKGVIDRRVAGTVFSGPLADQARVISAADDAWFVSSVPGSFLAGKLPSATGPNANGFNPGNMLQSVVQTAGGAKFVPEGIKLSLEALTRSNQDAQSLADVLRFGLSLLQMNRNNNPNAGKAASIADTATFSASGPMMRVSVTLPEQQVEQLFIPSARPAGGAPKKVALR